MQDFAPSLLNMSAFSRFNAMLLIQVGLMVNRWCRYLPFHFPSRKDCMYRICPTSKTNMQNVVNKK
jgi:Zn-finger protein